MAKILPAGANVNLNLGDDPMDRLVQTVDLALKVGGAFQQAQDRRELRKNNSVQELNELIDLRQKAGPYINDDIQQELDIKTQQVFEDLDTYDDPLLNIRKNMAQQVFQNQDFQASQFKDSYNTYELTFKNNPIFNVNNYKDPEFLKKYKDMGSEELNKLMIEFDNHKAKLVNIDEEGNYMPKIMNYKNSASLANDFNNMDNILLSFRDALSEDDTVSDMEFMYMSRGLSREEMKVLREDITKLSKEKIKSFTTKADKANQMILSLEQKKDIKAMDVLEDMKKERATDVIVDQLRKAIAGTPYENYTISELESSLELQFEPTLANILDKFKQYKTNLELEKNKNIANMQKEIKRFNWWSPFNYSAQNKETLDNKNLLED
tara:strand:+ start:658 stop:1794 length:1137 start_codon:yes stop_codon:yes gene_type:complete